MRPANAWHSRLMDDADYMLKTADKWFEHREDKLSDAQINTDIDYYYSLLTTNVPPTSDPNNPASRNFDKYPILNQYEWCNYYYGGNPSQNGGIPHTYQMEVEWLRNWFNGQGTPAPGESYSIYSEYSDRMGNLDDFWLADRDINEPPDLKINNVVTNTGGTIAPGDSLKMSGPSGTIYYTTDGTDPREWTYVNGGGGVVSGGAVSASAQTYSSSITLNKTTQIKARVKNGSDWTALNEAVFSMNNVAPNLRITEIMYHPVDPNDEFIEFKNIGGSTINLAHCELTKGVNLTFPDMTLAPGAYTVAVRSIAEFNERYPGYSGTIAGEYTGNKLDNGGENIRLKDAAGNIIQEFDYEDGWFPITDGKGFSLNMIDPADPVLANWNKRLSWQTSNVPGGTPGDSHVANAVANDAIVINEVLTHTDDLVYGDWIELYNTSGVPVNISNWYLSDDIDNLKKYRIAAGTAPIPAGGYKVFTSISNFRNAGDPGALVQFGLSEHGEEVFLTSGNGSDISGGYSIGENFGAAHNDVSFGRYIKGAPTYNVDFVQMTSQTRGSANPIAPYVPDVVIAEIMYNAQSIEDLLGEYIELYNRSGSTVYLYDVANPSNTWQFTKGIDFAFPTGASIAAGERILISRANPDTFKFANGISGVQVFGPFENYTELANDGEKIELSVPGVPDPGTEFVSYIRLEQVNYSDGIHPLVGDPWPTGADARGDSLQRSSVSNYSNDVSNWTAATPTPGS